MHHQQHNTKAGIKQAAQGGEALPVVELKPFTKKVWRREKSLPNFYDTPVLKPDSGTESSRAANSGPPPGIMRYIRELSEQRKTWETRQSADSTQRYRSKLHPKADFSFEGWCVAEHQQDLIPSFISRQDRTRSTLAEDVVATGGGVVVLGASSVNTTGNVTDRSTGSHGGGGGGGGDRGGGTAGGAMLGREVSNLMAAYIRDKPLQQQQVCLTGDKLSMANVGRRPLTYLNPYSTYRHHKVWNAMQSENSPAAGGSPRHNVSLAGTARAHGAVPVSANGLPVRQELVLSGSTFFNPDRAPPLQPLRARQSSPHKFNSKLGAAQDSLLTLSKAGNPTVLERHLSFDQSVRMDRCRRERSFAAIGETNILATAHYVAYDSQPTRGEVTLMKAREANKSRDGLKAYKRNGLQKPLTSLTPFGHHPPSLFVLGPVVDNSPRSVKSQVGDSGILSSPRDPAVVLAQGGDAQAAGPAQVQTDLSGEAIPEYPEDQAGKVEAVPSTTVHAWMAEEALGVVQDDGGSDLVESTDGYQRPLSDTAATETVLLRNEQTPMSAENRARLLPRDDSYISADAERVHTSHRQHRASTQPAAPLDSGVPSDGAVQHARTPAGAGDVRETNADVAEGEKSVAMSSDQIAEAAEPGGVAGEAQDVRTSEDNTVSEPTSSAVDKDGRADADRGGEVDDGSQPAAAASAATASVPGDDSVEAAFRKVGPPAGSGENTETDSGAAVAMDTRKDDSGGSIRANDLVLVSVNSNAPSIGNVDSARDPENQQSADSDAPQQGADSTADMDSPSAETGNKPVVTGTTVDLNTTAQPATADASNVDQGEGQLETKEIPSAQESEDRQESEPEKTSTGPGEASTSLSTEDIAKSEQAQADEQKQDYHIGQAPDTEEHLQVLDEDRNVSKTTPRQELDTAADSSTLAGGGETEPPDPVPAKSATSSSDSNSVSSGREGPTTSVPTTDKVTAQPSTISADDQVNIDRNENVVKDGENTEKDLNGGMEAIVTVTMEPGQTGDNFDGSKTFLTTTNVESEEWKNMVKV